MSVDREQIRRDAAGWLFSGMTHPLIDSLAQSCLALLTELEQAERERDERGSKLAAALRDECRAREVAEARLAKVPALVEAADQAVRFLIDVLDARGEDNDDDLIANEPSTNDGVRILSARDVLREALAAWEQE